METLDLDRLLQRKQRELPSSVPEIKELLDSFAVTRDSPESVDDLRKAEIIDMLVAKFSSIGLREDDEPNELGLAIESLIDIFNRD